LILSLFLLHLVPPLSSQFHLSSWSCFFVYCFCWFSPSRYSLPSNIFWFPWFLFLFYIDFLLPHFWFFAFVQSCKWY
jgi:hypothetical protein